MKLSWRTMIAVLGILGILGTGSIAATVTQSITYQGKLTDAAGTPRTGTFTVVFSLYGSPTGGTALTTSTQSVTAMNGLFTTPVAFDQKYFNGSALWLGVKVGSDAEMTPRQEIRPVPYALGLRPWVSGASFTTDRAGTGSPIGTIIPAINISTEYIHNTGILIDITGDGSRGMFARTSGIDSHGVISSTSGYHSKGVVVSTEGDFSEGVYATTSGPYSSGVAARTSGGTSYGVYAYTDGDFSDGVYASTKGYHSEGVVAETHGDSSYGVSAYAQGDSSYGVYASSSQSIGVYGTGKEGGYFTTNEGGTDWWTNRRPAINVSTEFPVNPGITINTEQSVSPGAYSTTHGDSSQGFATMTYGSGSPGLNAYTLGPNSYGVHATSAQSYGVYGDTGRADQKYGIYTPDYLFAKGTQVPAADVAEFMPVAEDVPPGTVLVIGDDGKLRPSSTAYDTRVAGIVSTDPGVTLGTKDGGNPGEVQVAVAGRVPCRVDAGYGAIHPGDMLTTSDHLGYAMKAEKVSTGALSFYLPGTILGKAMGTLESGTGTIEVLVTLQ